MPPGPAHAQQLVGHRLMVGGEDRAERGGDDVELPVGEGQRLRVGLDPLQLHPVRLGLAAARLEVLGREVRRDDLGPASAARIAVLPVPAATSSTRWPAEIPHASTSTGPSPQTVAFAKRW